MAEASNTAAVRAHTPPRRRSLALQLVVFVAGFWLSAHTAWAQADALDEHVNRLTSELRCVVCQNQSIADSQAPLAMQLKADVRSRLASGASDAQIKQFLVQRYGEFVLYRPELTKSTLLLWACPAAFLAMGGWLWTRQTQRHTASAGHAEEDLLTSNDDLDTSTEGQAP